MTTATTSSPSSKEKMSIPLSDDIKKFLLENGIADGENTSRLLAAIEFSQELDKSWEECFIGLINLERKGMISLSC